MVVRVTIMVVTVVLTFLLSYVEIIPRTARCMVRFLNGCRAA